VLPRAHGSGIFTRGTTQVLNITTLASTSYGQMIDTMEEDTTKHYLHHYNFPPYSTGEVRPMRSPGRREIGHGALAERALLAVIPPIEDFPYTIRTVSEVVSSNGSTSMASVCASKVLEKPREELAPHAPRISKIMIKQEKIKDVIGKGGETINKIIAETGVEIDIEDSGLVMIASSDMDASKRAIEWIKSLTQDPEVGKIYEAKVVKMMDFGAFIETIPSGFGGLVHISQLAPERTEKVTDVINLGDVIKVKLTEIDSQGRLNFSKKAAESEK
jgi:polyribonucleotide nucleotidyltransferase